MRWEAQGVATVHRVLERIAAVMGETRRQYVLAGVSVIAGAAVVVAALVADERLARAGLALLLLAILVVLLDLRRRIGNIGRWVKRGTPERVRSESRGSNGGSDAGRVDAMTRRLMAAIESGRLEAIERHDETLVALRDVHRSSVPAAGLDPPEQPGRLAGQPAGLLDLTDLVQRVNPNLVVSIGSGPASVWIGYALRRCGAGRVVALEHDDVIVEQTRAAVEAHELRPVVDIRTARWADVTVGGETVTWYDPSLLDDVAEIDLLVVDERAAPDGTDLREQALPVLAGRLADDALIVVDSGESGDLARNRVIEHWRNRVDGLETDSAAAGAGDEVAVGQEFSAASVLRLRRAADEQVRQPR